MGAGSLCSREDVTLAVGVIVGYSAIKSATSMNKPVVLFLEKVVQAGGDRSYRQRAVWVCFLNDTARNKIHTVERAAFHQQWFSN